MIEVSVSGFVAHLFQIEDTHKWSVSFPLPVLALTQKTLQQYTAFIVQIEQCLEELNKM